MLSEYQAVSIPNSEIRTLDSTIVGDTFELAIVLPGGYAQSNARYPVVYAFPASPDVYLLWSIFSELAKSSEPPPVILVGVGYPTHDQRDLLRLRIRDHMPSPDEEMDGELAAYIEQPSVHADGAPQLLDALEQEIFPFVNANYRTKHDDRTFVGMSSAGILGVHALLNHPGAFQRYVCVSPPLFRSDKAIFRDEQAYFEEHDDLSAQVFLAVGEMEEDKDPFPLIKPQYRFTSNLVALAETLAARGYPGLDLAWHVFEGESHLSVVPAAYSRGLRHVFRFETGGEG